MTRTHYLCQPPRKVGTLVCATLGSDSIVWARSALRKEILAAATAAATSSLVLLQPLLSMPVVNPPLLRIRQHLIRCGQHDQRLQAV